MKYSILKITQIVKGKLINITKEKAAKKFVTSVNFDSRLLRKNSLFIPIANHNNPKVYKIFSDYTIAKKDGHKFIKDAKKRGAIASFADHKVLTDLPLIVVSDTQLAFWSLAKNYLKKINPKKIAITGSNGKTTTKDIISSVLSKKYVVHHTIASQNNEIGVPKTILNMPNNTKILIVEMGMDHFGQLAALSNLVKPDYAIITMIGEAHLAFFKTRDRIADAKMEIIKGLGKKGIFVYNGDEPLLLKRAFLFPGKKITFGQNKNNDFQISDISEKNKISFKINGKKYKINLLGKFNVFNATAALAVIKNFKINSKQIQTTFNNLKISANRLQILKGQQKETIISDIYNSNPTAAKEAIRILKNFPSSGKKIIVLGDMLELGKNELKLHLQLLPYLKKANFDKVILVGPLMKKLSTKIKSSWYGEKMINKLIINLENFLSKNDVVLLKASHALHFEKIEKALRFNKQ